MWHGRVSTKVARRRMEKNCLGDQRSPMGGQGLNYNSVGLLLDFRFNDSVAVE